MVFENTKNGFNIFTKVESSSARCVNDSSWILEVRVLHLNNEGSSDEKIAQKGP